MNKKSVTDVDVKGKRVLVRCDFNVPKVDRAGIFMHETHEIEDPGIVLGGLDADVVQRGA